MDLAISISEPWKALCLCHGAGRGGDLGVANPSGVVLYMHQVDLQLSTSLCIKSSNVAAYLFNLVLLILMVSHCLFFSL